MGRLQRKKAPDAKKRKSRDVNGHDSGPPPKKVQGTAKTATLFGSVSKNPTAKSTAVSVKPASAKQKTEPGKIRIFVDKSIQFLREVRVELKKVAWPSRKQTIGSTIVVLILVLLISLFLGVADIGLAGIIRFVLQ
jgi:preprotein translocase subunit SecE